MFGKTNICAREGAIPSGTIQITENGTVDVTQYAQAEVQVADPIYDKISTMYISQQTFNDTVVKIKMPQNCRAFQFINNRKVGTLELTINSVITNGNRMIYNNYTSYLDLSLTELKVDGSLANITLFDQCFADNKGLVRILGDPLDFSGASSALNNAFSGLIALETVRLALNTVFVSISFGSCSRLNGDSLISIINGLNEGVTGQTLTLHATPKATLSTIMGTVSLDETETYHIFTADPNGNTTLLDFATNIKGWTIA